jgi:class 3 adenylate cyclase
VTRLAAFVFSELTEGSATLARLGEARSERARRAYFDVVRTAAASVGGRELGVSGDGLLVAFESASGAIAFASCVVRGCDREGRRSGERLDVRVGIDVGETRWSETGEADGAGAAARSRQLARAADHGRVLATAVVAALAAEADARFTPAGLLQLPGSAESVSVVEVEWDRPVAVRVPLPPDAELGPGRTGFVGREAEWDRLEAVWRPALRGERQLVFVVGEPGIGKSRLAAEFARSRYEQGVQVLWGRSFEEALAPYQPFVHALEHHVRFTPPQALREQAAAGADVLARLLPELRSRLSLPAIAPVEDPESERYRLFEAVGALLATASGDSPVLLVLDDLHWADRGTLMLLKFLARHPAAGPLLLLGTYRHCEVGRGHPLALMQADVERDRVVERIELRGLAEDEVGRLVGGLIGLSPPVDVVRGLRDETEGNPFFLEELVRHLEQLGVGADAARLGRIAATVRELGVPARVRELVGRRVQLLAQPAREALSAAAVAGNEFDRDVLAEVLGASPAELVASLDEAVVGGLLVESRQHVGRYGFAHALVHQALYDDQTLNTQAALHERVAAALERLRPEAPELHAELAHHYARAGERHAPQVAVHGRLAGERALALLAYEDAIAQLSAAVGALDGAGDSRERSELLALLGTAHTRAGDAKLARAAFREAARLAASAGAWRTLAQAALGFGGGTGFGGIWETFGTVDDELVRLLEQALSQCPKEGSHERVRLLGRLAQALYWAPDKEPALALSEQAVASARLLGDPAALAYALDGRNVVLWGPDHLDEGRRLAEEMLVLGRDLGDRDIQLEALSWLITDALERGSIALVDGLIDEHAVIAAELRQPYRLWFTEVLRAMRAHLDGRLAEADDLCRGAYAYGEQAHGENALQVFLAQALFLRLDQGRAEELYAELSAQPGWPPRTWHAAAALTLAGLDRRDEALEHVAWFSEQGLAAIPRDAVWMMIVVALGRTIAHFDDPTYADELYELLLPFADRTCVLGGAVVCLGPASRILGMLARAARRPDDALKHLAASLEQSRALGSPSLVARTQLEAAKAHLLRRTDDDRAAAERLLDEAGATAAALEMRKLGQDIELLRASLRAGAPG